MKLIKKNLIVVILLLIVIVLGIFVVKKYFPIIQENVLTKTTPSVTPVVTNSPQPLAIPRPPFLDKLSSDEQKVLTPPTADSRPEVKKGHYDLASKMAQEADGVDLQDCKPARPLVLKVPSGSDILVKNSSAEDHTINLNKDTSYTIKAKSSKVVHYNAFKGAGLYGYGCDHTPYAVGYFLIEKPDAPSK